MNLLIKDKINLSKEIPLDIACSVERVIFVNKEIEPIRIMLNRVE